MNCPAQSDKDCWYQHPERRRLEAEVRDLKARIALAALEALGE